MANDCARRHSSQALISAVEVRACRDPRCHWIAPNSPSRMRKNTTNPQSAMIREGMRGEDHQQNHVFSYLSPEMRVRPEEAWKMWGEHCKMILNEYRYQDATGQVPGLKCG